MRRPEEHHRPLRRLLRRHGLRGQHQGTAHDPGAGGDGPAGGGPGGKTGDLCRAGRRGGPDRYLLFHALPEAAADIQVQLSLSAAPLEDKDPGSPA